MSQDLSQRKRRVNTETLEKDAGDIGMEIGKKCGPILEKAGQDINKILAAYGLTAQVAYCLIDPKTGETLTNPIT